MAAYFFEPIQGEGGYVPAPPEYFKRMEFLRKDGVLFVDDEIQTGMGRTGKFFAVEHYGLVPDVVSIAKGIASGLPLSATVARADVMKSWEPGQHASTFGANPIAVEAALATLEVFKAERLVENARRLGKKAVKRLLEMKEKYEIVGDVRGMGLFIGVEIVRSKKTKEKGVKEAEQNHTVLLPARAPGHNGRPQRAEGHPAPEHFRRRALRRPGHPRGSYIRSEQDGHERLGYVRL